MPNGLTDRQVEELDRAAARFVEEQGAEFGTPLPSIAVREANGEAVYLYEKVEAQLSMLQPKNREEKRERGERHRALSNAWDELRREALKRAKS